MRRSHAIRETTVSGRTRQAAITLFRKLGYQGTTLRDLARVVGIEAGSLYYYFPAKQEILSDVIDRVMDDLLTGVREATAGLPRPIERLKAAVRFHILFHARRTDEAFISRSELRSLTPASRRRTIAKRDLYERFFRNLLAEGVQAGVLSVPEVSVAAMAILGMCSSVAEWFGDRGRLSPEAIADLYAELIVRMVGASESP